jgi:hypothetical protein
VGPSRKYAWAYQAYSPFGALLQARFSRLSSFAGSRRSAQQCPFTLQPSFFLGGKTFPIDPLGVITLANALRERTTLEEFTWVDLCSRLEAAPPHLSPDLVLLALPAHLQQVTIMTKCASDNAMKNLLQLGQTTGLRLVMERDQWLAMADEIRRGRCNVQKLTLCMCRAATSDATEAFKAIASAIREDSSLEEIVLRMDNGFTNSS